MFRKMPAPDLGGNRFSDQNMRKTNNLVRAHRALTGFTAKGKPDWPPGPRWFRWADSEGSVVHGWLSPASASASLLRQSLRLRIDDSAASARSKPQTASSVTEIGRWKKIVQLPFDMISD